MITESLTSWYSVTEVALMGLWQDFIAFIPKLIGAIIVFSIGWLIAVFFGKVIKTVLLKFKLDEVFEKTGWVEALGKARVSVKPSEFLGGIVKWVVAVAFMVAAVDVLEFNGLGTFLGGILDYLPNVIIASLIFVVTVILADIVEKIVVASVEKVKVKHARMAGTITRWAIWFFSISAILLQLDIFPKELITTILNGFVGVFVLAFGLAFGLGGKEVAADTLRGLKRKFEEK